MATPGALHVLEQLHVDPRVLLSRHQAGDWGDLCPADRDENHLSIKEGFRILSNYPVGDDERLWVITQADRSVTTILLPSEY